MFLGLYKKLFYTQSANVIVLWGKNPAKILKTVLATNFTGSCRGPINQAPIPKNRFNYFSYDIHGNVEWMIQKDCGIYKQLC